MTSVSELQSTTTQAKPIRVSASIDWISVTYKAEYRRQGIPLVLQDDHINGYDLVRGSMGYTQAKRYQSGALEMWHPTKDTMGIHVVYSGAAIKSACENFNTDVETILDYLTQYGRLSRLDMCYDVFDIPVDIRSLFHDMVEGKIDTSAKQFDYVESAKSGNSKGAQTLYFGSMKKRKKLLRVYDKGMQLNLDDYMTRFELETHGEIARNAGKALIDNMADISTPIVGMIKGFADFTQTAYSSAFDDSDKLKIAHKVYQKGDTANWLIETVARTLAKEADKDYNVLQEFLARFQQEYQSIQYDKEYNKGF